MRAVVPLLLLAAACATQTDPVTGKPYRAPIGNDFASQDRFVTEAHLTPVQLAIEGGELPDPEIRAACEEIFRKVAAAVPDAHRRGFRYTLYLTTAMDVNAYTYGAGRIHCHLGLLARCRDAAEFAGVLAHEIGHNSHDHVGQSLGRAQRADRILGFGGIAGKPGRVLGGLLGGGVARFALVRHSREQEREADRRAVEYTAAAGIDPAGLARFFAARAADHDASGLALFKTHPSPEARVDAILAGARATGVAGVRSTPAFDRALARARALAAHYAALETALATDEPDRILAAARHGASAHPRHPQFHLWAGLALLRQEDGPGALDALRRADALDTTNYLIPYVRALLELGTGDAAEAELAATRSLELLPPQPGALFVRGAARLDLGRTRAAYADFDALLALLPRSDRDAARREIRKRAPDYQ